MPTQTVIPHDLPSKFVSGFSDEMISIILFFNILLKPIVPASNVMANSALCNILENIWAKLVHKFGYVNGMGGTKG